jgi:hypothetical protein
MIIYTIEFLYRTVSVIMTDTYTSIESVHYA